MKPYDEALQNFYNYNGLLKEEESRQLEAKK